ncbi:MAG: carboxylating nicotinate-nucleotide diphosphorylase [Candidatus Eisenbacteria bacterium]|nr:carboxylating nicotinate-nucleotide diphosphorylase [Candidatus Eisenbacteria bacterium]
MARDEGLGVVEEAMARLALLEDVGEGDLTAALVPEGARAVAVVRARQKGVLSGLGVARAVFRAVDPGIEIESPLEPGEPFGAGDRILTARGSGRALLTAERSALNFLQRLSGVATLTARFVEAARSCGSTARISDTRKTTPGLRLLEKEAVLHGGGTNHRLGLYDAVMIKENHIAVVGGISQAVEAARRAHPGRPIIVEVRAIEEAREAARLDVGRILLDNRTPEEVASCVAAIREVERRLPARGADDEGRWLPDTWRPGDPRIQVEVSGGIRLDAVARYALAGVDFLSVGALTHSAPAVDMSMDIEIGA